MPENPSYLTSAPAGAHRYMSFGDAMSRSEFVQHFEALCSAKDAQVRDMRAVRGRNAAPIVADDSMDAPTSRVNRSYSPGYYSPYGYSGYEPPFAWSYHFEYQWSNTPLVKSSTSSMVVVPPHPVAPPPIMAPPRPILRALN